MIGAGLGHIATVELDLRGGRLYATLERAKSHGGSTEFVHTVPKHGRVGSLHDPGGAVFAIRGPVP